MDNEKSGIEKSGIFTYLGQDKPGRSSRVPHALAIAASTVIILAGIKLSSALVAPILLALFIAIILLVPLRWLQLHGCPGFLSYPIVLGCTTALFIGVTFFVWQSLDDFIGRIPTYKDRFVTKYADLKTNFEQYVERLGFVIGELGQKVPLEEEKPVEEPSPDKPASPEPATPVMLPVIAPEPETIDRDGEDSEDGLDPESGENAIAEKVPDDDVPSVPEETIKWVKEMEEKDPLPIALDSSVVAYWIARVMIYLQSMLGAVFLVLLFTIFMLFEAAHFPQKVNRAFGTDGPINIKHFHHIAEEIRRYLFLKTIANLMSGSAAMFVYYMFGVPGALFWGIIAFFMYYIPNLGGTLAAVIPGVLIFMTSDISTLLLYAVCLLVIECSIAYGIEPKILGHGLRLSTLVIILSLFFWGFLLGAIGLFLAAPLTVMIKIILQAFPETRWLAVFLDGGREKP